MPKGKYIQEEQGEHISSYPHTELSHGRLPAYKDLANPQEDDISRKYLEITSKINQQSTYTRHLQLLV